MSVHSNAYEFLGETKFDYEDMIKKCVSKAMKHGSDGMSKLLIKVVEQMWNQISPANQGSSAKQNSGESD